MDLNNIMWRCLFGSQKDLSIGDNNVRRFKSGISELVGFRDSENPDLDGLARISTAGDNFYSVDWDTAITPGWTVLQQTRADQMVWQLDSALPPKIEIVSLDKSHVAQMLMLIELTQPGPFQPKTIEMGEYFGVFDDGVLVAMAGERLFAYPLREISGVCTRPGYEGRGFARNLMQLLIARQLNRNEMPFLHVVEANVNARRIYEKMGFKSVRQTTLRKFVRS